MSAKTQTPSPPHRLGIFSLVIIAAAFVISIRNLPMMAEAGLQMIFFAVIAVIAFLIPVALVAAELATGWPKEGGVYVWVKEAFGDRWGFVAVWLLWFQMVIGMVMVLSFVGGVLAYAIYPSLAQSKLFIIGIIIAVYWGATFLNLRGMKASSMISTVCLISGVFFPAALIISLGIAYLFLGDPVQMNLAFSVKNMIPDLTKLDNVVMLASFIFAFSGMELSAVHAAEVNNPKRNYPIAIFMASILLVAISIIGAVSVAIVVPQSKISLVSGIMEAFEVFFSQFRLKWFTPVIAIFAGVGAVGQVSTWIVGPVKCLLATAKNGDIPPFFQKVNRNGIPKRLLFVQASLVSLFALLYGLIPKINTAFMMLLALTILLYLCMYILMFMSAIRLRYKEPDVFRAYKVPGGKIGMWIVAGIGFLTSIATFFIGLFPPSELKVTNTKDYVKFMIIGVLVMLVIPIIIFQLRRPSWKLAVKQDQTNKPQ